MKGIQVLDRPASQNFYAVAGRLLFTESFDHHLGSSIERLFAGWQLTPVSFPEHHPDVKLSFSSAATLPDVPPGLTQFEIAEGGRCYAGRSELYLRYANSLLRLRETNPVTVSVWISKASDVELAHLTSFAVCAALRRFGLFDLHSACVVLPRTDDGGVLIVGHSGCGKSTLTHNLATAGWGYLSDDELLLNVADETVEARGFRSFFALARRNVDSHRALKLCFEPENIFAAPAVSLVLPRFVFFASISGVQETHITELTQAETMTRLIRACPWATYDTTIARANLNLLSRLVRQAKGFALGAGIDLLEPRNASRIIRAACHA